jgi:serine/threonine protein kinase
MAPEQARDHGVVDARADVFALGCVLFQCLTGTPAFHGDSAIAIVAKILFGETPRVSALWPEVPADLDALSADPATGAASSRTSRRTPARSRSRGRGSARPRNPDLRVGTSTRPG